MDTELYIHPKATNNNPPVVGKNAKWSTPNIKGLASLEEDDEGPPPPVATRGRRKSWAVGKLEKLDRKRRTGVGVGVGVLPSQSPKYERQKRHSWWSIFVPDQLQTPSRSRRSSQEAPPAPQPRRASEITIPHIPWLRNKSRSVDHGVTPPFDLDALRSKVEGRLDKLSRAADTDGEGGSRESLAERKMQPSIPVKTTTYTVEASDTLTSVAARFDTTPSELAILNRLPSRTVFPGQVIRVPDKSGKGSEADDDADLASHTASTDRSEHTDDEDTLESLRVSSPKPGHVERVGTPSSPSLERFLKINVKHITDGQGVVSGVLLVTPNAVMFDPNVSDPLVIERGPESYGVIAPMEYVVNAAIYHDIAHMQVGRSINKCDLPKPEVYRMKSIESEGDAERSCLLTINQADSLESREHSTKDLRSSTEEDDTYWNSSGVQREGDAFPKAFERDLVTPTIVPTDKSSDAQEQSGDKGDDEPYIEDGAALVRALENRRKSCLDHHWAVPSQSVDKDKDSLETDKDSFDKDKDSFEKDNSLVEQVDEERRGSEGHLVKLSCHDSGIDIRDPPPLPPIVVARKTVYSDADVLLAGDGEFVPPIPVQPLHSSDNEKPDDEKKKQTVSFSIDDDQKKDDDKQETKKNKMLKRLSYPLAWMEGITGSDEKDSLPSSADSHPSHSSSVFSKVFSRRSSVGTFIRQQHVAGQVKPGPKLDYRSMVSVEDMPELFVSFDKLIPRPARSYEDPPLYLRLRMGKPKDKKIPKYTPIMSYGKKKMKPEYWFSVPRERVDELYRFLLAWVPHLYGDLDEEVVAGRGFELVDSDTELWDSEDLAGPDRRPSDGDLSDIPRESWEVLSMSGELRRALYATSVPLSQDFELFLPDLVGNTEILTEDHRKQLCRHLPARAEGYVWTLVFSTSQHGFSLNSMYRKMTKLESPILMVIEDTDNNVFGALTSCSLKVSDHFYGTGESLLYRFAPECQIYNWTGENLYFIKGNNESLSIGAGDGKFGLWLDGDLYQGRTESCSTYANEPLTPQQDFVVKTLECWAFV